MRRREILRPTAGAASGADDERLAQLGHRRGGSVTARHPGRHPASSGARLPLLLVVLGLLLTVGRVSPALAQGTDPATPMSASPEPGSTAAVGTHGEPLADEPLADEAAEDEAAGVAWPASVEAAAVAAIAEDLNCPLCQGYNLQDCPLVVCQQMRALIAQKLAAGDSREAIVDDFVAEYGPQVLNAPPNEGLHRVVWWLPFLVVIVAATTAVAYARRDNGSSGPVDAETGGLGEPGVGGAPDEVSPEHRQELESLLRERR